MSGNSTSQCWCCVQLFRKRGAKQLGEDRHGPVYKLSDFGVHVSKRCQFACCTSAPHSLDWLNSSKYLVLWKLQQRRQHVAFCKMP
jgi:hypothetical protein